MVIQGLLFQSSAASDFYKIGEVRLCNSEFYMGNTSRPEQEAQAPQARQVGFVVSAWGAAIL